MIDYYYDHPDARKFPDYWEKKAASRLDLLRRIEWSLLPFEAHYIGCPVCENPKDEGHASDCELAKELGDD